MASDSEDDPDYVPSVPQNDGLYACSQSFWQLTSSIFADSGSFESGSDNGRSAKRIRASPRNLTAEDEEARKKM